MQSKLNCIQNVLSPPKGRNKSEKRKKKGQSMESNNDCFSNAFVLFCIAAEVILVYLLCLADLPEAHIALWSCLGWFLIPLTCALPCVVCFEWVGRCTPVPPKASNTPMNDNDAMTETGDDDSSEDTVDHPQSV